MSAARRLVGAAAALVAAAGIGFGLFIALPGPTGNAAPPTPLGRAAVDALVGRVLGLPLPSPIEGEVRVGPASVERRLQRSFLETQVAQPQWRDEGIVVAAGTHRLEVVAETIGRPDLLSCDGRLCRLSAPVAVESGATLVIDQLTVELEQSTGTVIVAFGDLFLSTATIQGRNGERLATTDGSSFRPFIVAYDASRTVIRDSQLMALGYDAFGTTGLAFLTASRDEPAGRPEVELVASVIEDIFDGVFVRGGGMIEIVRNIVTASHRHGLALRDGTSNVLVAANTIAASGAAAENGNGILVSRGVSEAVLSDNTVEGSAASAILVNNGSFDVSIVGNILSGSGRDALVVYESSAIDMLGNTIVGSGRSAIRVRASDGIRIEENALRENARVGLDLHDWSVASREPNEEEEALIRPTVVTAMRNTFTDNARGDCAVEGEVTMLPDGDHDC